MHSVVLFMDINVQKSEILFTPLFYWKLLYLSMVQQTILGYGLLIIEASRSHSHTLARAPLDEWSARNRELYLTTHNAHKRQTSMRSAGFEPAFLASKRPQTHSLNRAATGIAWNLLYRVIFDSLYILWLTYTFRLKKIVIFNQITYTFFYLPSKLLFASRNVWSQYISVIVCIYMYMYIYCVSGLQVYKNTCLYFST